ATATSAIRVGAVVAAFSTLSALVASGCGSDGQKYYCDSTGCYQCDGYGCGSVSAPPSQSCTGNASCPTGQICTSNGCTEQCTSSTSCPMGTVCTSGLCVAPTADAGTPIQCTTTADCTGGE